MILMIVFWCFFPYLQDKAIKAGREEPGHHQTCKSHPEPASARQYQHVTRERPLHHMLTMVRRTVEYQCQQSLAIGLASVSKNFVARSYSEASLTRAIRSNLPGMIRQILPGTLPPVFQGLKDYHPSTPHWIDRNY